MRQFPKDKSPGKICLPVVERSMEAALRTVAKANQLADLIELRLDYLPKFDLEQLLKSGKKPIIVTNRRREDGGKYKGDEKSRLGILRQAVNLGADFVDLEMESGRSFVHELIANKKNTRLILSFHDFKKTLKEKELRALFKRMIQIEADVVKIVTFARAWEDNLKILSLIPYAKERSQKIVAFCMGEKGKMSRIFAPLLGAAWTYASLNRKSSSAPGQLTVGEIKEIWRNLQ
ncbi:MAG: type I 3-dehydroquinate dehydratase [Deltaproteobacteria bacterium]|nr:type I 3-dehydroquinate dehydratase [Deltaproteobacteria bacterium]